MPPHADNGGGADARRASKLSIGRLSGGTLLAGMTIRTLAVFVASFVAIATSSARASAHTVGVSRGEYVYENGVVWVGVAFARQELADQLTGILGHAAASNLAGFEERRDDIGRWLVDRLSISAGDVPCAGTFGGMRFDGDGLALAVAYACDGASSRFQIEARFVGELMHGHRHLATFSEGQEVREAVGAAGHVLLDFDLRASRPPATPAPVFLPLLRMGIEHILTGYDHLLFLLGLVLVGRPIRSLVGAITAFTLAHSVTLAVSAFDVWTPSSRVIEPCIALSIAYVGIENWFVGDAIGRWKVTFPFGLLHGFGFASALREIALPSPDVPVALFAFNLGVELGQIAVVAILLPLVLALREREAWARIGLRTCTVTIALAGVVWFVARLHSSI